MRFVKNSLHLSGFWYQKGHLKKKIYISILLSNMVKYDHFNESIDNHKFKRFSLNQTKSNYIFILLQKDKLVVSNKIFLYFRKVIKYLDFNHLF